MDTIKKGYYILLMFCLSCVQTNDTYTAQEIVDKAIEKSGVVKLKEAKLSFDFRDMHYTAKRTQGNFVYTRSFDSIKDELSNTKFNRYIYGKKVQLSDSLANVYSNSVNSVHYFSILPFYLNDKAVRKERLPNVKIKNQDYYKVKVSFAEEGGGEDYQDVFIYWFHKESFSIDYLAYSYETDGGGMRFRETKNKQLIEGIHFNNYSNYKPTKEIDLIDIDKSFSKNELEKVSEIELNNIKVSFH